MKTFALISGVLSILIGGGVYYNNTNIDELTPEIAKQEIVGELQADNPCDKRPEGWKYGDEDPCEDFVKYEDGKFLVDGVEVEQAIIDQELTEVKAEAMERLDREELRRTIIAARQDFKARYLAMRKTDMHRIRKLLQKAGENHNISNPDAFLRDKIKSIRTAEDIAVVETWMGRLEAKLQELEDELALESQEKEALKTKKAQARQFLKGFDCEALSNNFQKAICYRGK